MQRNALRNRGSPTPRTAKNEDGGTARCISIVNRDISNSVPGDLLARTIAARPPNEDRIRGMVA